MSQGSGSWQACLPLGSHEEECLMSAKTVRGEKFVTDKGKKYQHRQVCIEAQGGKERIYRNLGHWT